MVHLGYALSGEEHPAPDLVAHETQAAATVAQLVPGRFMLGQGTGDPLWPT